MAKAVGTTATVPVLDWRGCYDDGWGDLIVADAYQHPAKFARGLIQRIYAHGFERGYFAEGDLIADPFGGVALGGIVAAYHGLRWVGVELEQKFVALGRENISLHTLRLRNLNGADFPLPVLLQGDSRRFAEFVAGADGVVTSPPFGPQETGAGLAKPTARYKDGTRIGTNCGYQNQGSDPAKIAGLPEGDVAAVVTSPPYADSITGDNAERETARESTAKRRTAGGSLGQSQRHGGYGCDRANIGNLPDPQAGLPGPGVDGVVTSPPYAGGGHHADQTGSWGGALCGHPHKGLGSKDSAGYGSAPGQIGQLPAGAPDAVVTSPPWEKQEPSHAQGSGFTPPKQGPQTFINAAYGDTPGQVGREAGETYWRAMATVYGQCFLALKPGGVMAVVVKDYVKAGARVRLCEQTLRLLAHVGFSPLEVARAHLVSETVLPSLFGAPSVRRKERKSFFRRLHERKLAPDSNCRIDWEEVLFVRKPGGAAGKEGTDGHGD